VVQGVVDALELKNVKAEQLRAENVKGDFDFIVSRNQHARFCFLDKTKSKKATKHKLKRNLIPERGDLTEELAAFRKHLSTI
jgi:16S rRNA (guanine527-N7)-methyltransferase